jgi:hypothetical protein
MSISGEPGECSKIPCETSVRFDLERYGRYQAFHDRAYQCASKERQERRKQRLKVEIGFESQKCAQALSATARQNSRLKHLE